MVRQGVRRARCGKPPRSLESGNRLRGHARLRVGMIRKVGRVGSGCNQCLGRSSWAAVSTPSGTVSTAATSIRIPARHEAVRLLAQFQRRRRKADNLAARPGDRCRCRCSGKADLAHGTRCRKIKRTAEQSVRLPTQHLVPAVRRVVRHVVIPRPRSHSGIWHTGQRFKAPNRMRLRIGRSPCTLTMISWMPSGSTRSSA